MNVIFRYCFESDDAWAQWCRGAVHRGNPRKHYKYLFLSIGINVLSSSRFAPLAVGIDFETGAEEGFFQGKWFAQFLFSSFAAPVSTPIVIFF